MSHNLNLLLLPVFLCAGLPTGRSAKSPTGILIVGGERPQTFDPIGIPHADGNITLGLPQMQFATGTMMPDELAYFVKGGRAGVMLYVVVRLNTVNFAPIRA